ncbi:MAG: hypothetical protein NTX53_10240 [candidate division WOR-3 bacterium]|nr:hypothetical protein [candidate division WOR-3 bacterium]
MTFLTLLLVVTQAVSIGVVDEPLVLANGTRLMPGDRVLAIPDSTHPWLTFLPSGEFLPLDSSRIIIAGQWQPPDVDMNKHPEAESGAWSEPSRQSQRRPLNKRDLPFMFTHAHFSYGDSSFWGSVISPIVTGWVALTRQEVLRSMSGFGPSADSSRARAPYDLASRLPQYPDWSYLLPDSLRRQNAARLYELSIKISTRYGYRELAATALLALVNLDIKLKADSAAAALCRRAVREFVGVKSVYGRTDVYAYWQLMELAWRHKDIAQTSSLARKIIIDYPTDVAEAQVVTGVGIGPSLVYAKSSIWFDVKAAGRLLDAVAGDEKQEAAAAEFLTRSANVAVRFLGYKKLVALSMKRSDTAAARSYTRTALSLPHYWQLEVWPPGGCADRGGSRKHDFKEEFIDSLDVLLPFADLLQLYDSTYNSKDTMMSRDAANWFMRQIERGRTPPRAGILDRIDPPTNSAELRRALLVSMTDAPQYRTALECTLFTRRPGDYPSSVFSQALPSGSLVQPYGMREGWVRVATPNGLSGWTNARSLRGAVSVWDIPAVEMAEPVASADFNGDGVRDLRLSTTDLFDGKGLATVRPPDRKNSWLRQIGVFRRKWVELRGDTLWLQGVGADTIATGVPVARRTKKGVCKPGSCFYFVAMPGPNDSFAWVSAVRERGTVWTSPVSIRKDYPVGVCQIDSALVVLQEKEMWLLSATNGALRGQVATRIYLKSWRGVFFNQSGYAVAKGDSVIYHDYSGSKTFGVAVGKSDAKFFPPFAVSPESGVWGVGNFGQPLCPVAAEAIPVVSLVHGYDGERWRYDIALHLISLMDGRELATVAMSENNYDCHYDEHGIYVSDDTSFRAITWEGKPLPVPDLPLLSYPIWDGDRVVSYYSKPMGLMLEAGAASRLADAVRPLRSKWPAMDNPRESGEW